MQSVQQNQSREKLLNMQIQNFQSEIEARKLAGVKDARQQDFLESLSRGGRGPDGSATASGSPNLMQLAEQYGIPRQAIQADLALNGGKNISDMLFKRGAPNMKVTNGYGYDENQLKPGYLPQLNISNDGKATQVQIGADGQPVISAPRGAPETFGTYQGIEAGVKSANTPMQVQGTAPDGSPQMQFVPQSRVLGGQGAAPTPPGYGTEPQMKASMAGGMGADPAAMAREIQALSRDVLNPTLDAPSRKMLQDQLVSLRGQQSRLGTPSAQAPTPPSGFAAGPSASEKLSSEAGSDVNKTWLKTSYEPVKVAGDAANDMLTNVQVARQSMANMGGTGWGTEAKATGAAILSSLGIAPKNAELYASNAQTFQSASMSNLTTTLNAAKGPQTEGDADRAGKTFAQLKNTPQANSFILDLSEAKAQRDQLKARFYEQALPIAQGKGNLQEVDREWSKRTPSVFSMPSMQKWSQK
jgi:hypothetical protein